MPQIGIDLITAIVTKGGSLCLYYLLISTRFVRKNLIETGAYFILELPAVDILVGQEIGIHAKLLAQLVYRRSIICPAENTFPCFQISPEAFKFTIRRKWSNSAHDYRRRSNKY